MTIIKRFCALVVTTNGLALNHDKGLKIYFVSVKRQVQNDFLKEAKSTLASVK